MVNANQPSRVLYDYISTKYSSIPKFAEVAAIPQEELSAVLLSNAIDWMKTAFKVFTSLKIDAEKFLINGEISEVKATETTSKREHSGGEFFDFYIRLSESEKALVLDFVKAIFNGNEQSAFSSPDQSI